MIEANDISLMLQGKELLREYESHSGQVYLVSAKPIPDQEVIRGGVIVISSMDMAQAP